MIITKILKNKKSRNNNNNIRGNNESNNNINKNNNKNNYNRKVEKINVVQSHLYSLNWKTFDKF